MNLVDIYSTLKGNRDYIHVWPLILRCAPRVDYLEGWVSLVWYFKSRVRDRHSLFFLSIQAHGSKPEIKVHGLYQWNFPMENPLEKLLAYSKDGAWIPIAPSDYRVSEIHFFPLLNMIRGD